MVGWWYSNNHSNSRHHTFYMYASFGISTWYYVHVNANMHVCIHVTSRKSVQNQIHACYMKHVAMYVNTSSMQIMYIGRLRVTSILIDS